MNLSHTGSFKCHICTYAFKEKTKLTEHIKILHSPTEDNISDGEDLATEKSLSSEVNWSQFFWERWDCMTYHKRFVKEEWFNNHMQEVHSKQDKKRKADEQEVDLNTIPRPEKSLKSNQFKCNFCTQTFSKKYNAERHTKRTNG